MVDRMLKAFDTLKQAPESAEQDTAAKRKDRLAACACLQETVCAPSIRTTPEFQKLLAVSVAGLLSGCADPDSDVRLNADECLNRTITTLIESHLGRLQVELYKAIKKAGSHPRTLRAALSKFAELCHLVKPSKKSVFVTSLLPSLIRIIDIRDESVQETMASSIDKICDSLGLFFSDPDTQQLLAALLDNLSHPSAVIRRTAADCAVSVCTGSRSPYHYLMVLNNSLFSLCPLPLEDASDAVLLGTLLCFRKVMIGYQTLQGMVTPVQQIMDAPATDRLFEMLMRTLESANHNIVTASLEALQQLLQIIRRDLLGWFRQPAKCGRAVQRLGQFLLGTERVRTSVKGIALSCLTTMFLYEPSVFRLQVQPCDRPMAAIIDEYISHSDPLLRGTSFSLLGNLITSSLQFGDYVFAAVPPLPEHYKAAGFTAGPETSQFKLMSLCKLLASALNDETSTATRLAVAAVRTCLNTLCLSETPSVGLELAQHVLALRENQYWLVKTEILSTVGSIDYMLLSYLSSLPYLEQGLHFSSSVLSHPKLPFGGKPDLQATALAVTMQFAVDDDARVRASAAETLTKLISRLFYPTDWPSHDPLLALADRKAAFMLNSSQAQSASDSVEADAAPQPDILQANMSRLVKRVVSRLYMGQSRTAIMGCYHALNRLAETYSKFNIDVKALEESLPPLYPADVMPLALDHLRAPWMSLDLSVHVDVLALIRSVSRESQPHNFRPYIPQLLSHVLRVLNICVHVINGAVPQPPKARSKDRSPAKEPARGTDLDEECTGAAPPGSPRGYFANHPHYMRMYETFQGAYTTSKISLDSAKSRFGEIVKVCLELLAIMVEYEGTTFSQFAREVLFYLQVVIVPEPRAVLLCVQQLLLALFGTPATRRILSAVASSTSLSTLGKTPSRSAKASAAATAAAVAAASAEPAPGFFERVTTWRQLSGGGPSLGPSPASSLTSLSSKDEEDDRLVGMGLGLSPGPGGSGLAQQQAGAAGGPTGSSGNTGGASNGGPSSGSGNGSAAARNRAQSNVSTTSSDGASPLPVRAKPRRGPGDAVDKAAMYNFIRLFEPLVIRAMNLYSTTSSIPLQQQILFLLCRLMTLRVNYALLDKDQLFLKSVLRQLELIRDGHLRQAQNLLSYIFQFLVLLVHDTTKTPNSMSMDQILRQAGALLSPRSKIAPAHALHALRPIVREMFLTATKGRSSKQVAAQRGQVVNLLIASIKFPAVMHQVNVLLRAFQRDEDKLKRLSRKVIDALLPLLSRGEVPIRSAHVLGQLHMLFSLVAPISIRPIVLLLRCMFQVAAPDVPLALLPGDGAPRATRPAEVRSDAQPLPAADEPGPQKYHWLPVVLVMLKRIVATTPEGALLTGVANACAELDRKLPPGDVLVHFLLDALARSAERLVQHLAPVTDYMCQQFAQLLQHTRELLGACDPASSRILAAARRIGALKFPRLCRVVRPLCRTRPLLPLYLCQLLVCLDLSGLEFWHDCGLRDYTRGRVFRNSCQDIAQRGAFLLSCELLARQLSSPDPAAQALARGRIEALEPGWFEHFVQLCAETPVSRLVQTLAAPPQGGLRRAFLDTLASAVNQGTTCQTPKQSMQLAKFLRGAPPCLPVLRILLENLLVSPFPAVRRAAEALFVAKLDAFARDEGRPALAALHGAFCATTRAAGHDLARVAARFESLGVATPEAPSIEALMASEPEDWLFQFVTRRCGAASRPCRSLRGMYDMLKQLSAPHIAAILASPGFDYLLLPACLELGVQRSRCPSLWPQSASGSGAADATGLGGGGVDGGADGGVGSAGGVGAATAESLLNTVDSQDWAVGGGGGPGEALLEMQFLEAMATFCLDRAAAMHAEVGSTDWTEVVAVVRALGHYFDAHAGRGSMACVDWLPELTPLRVVAAQRMCSAALSRALREPVTPSDLCALLACATAIFSHPGVRYQMDAATSFAPWIIDAIKAVYQLYRGAAGMATGVDPWHERQPDEDDDGQAEAEAEAEAEVAEGEGNGVDGGGRHLGKLTWADRHQLCMLVRRLPSDLVVRAQPGFDRDAGSTRDWELPDMPFFLRSAFRGAAVAFARMAIHEVNVYALVSNPESGRPSRHAREFMKELHGPGASEIRHEILRDELVVRALVQRATSLGWVSTDDFAERWTTLLSLLARDPAFIRELGLEPAEADRTTVMAVRGATAMLLHAIRTTSPGQPMCPLIHTPRTRDISFLHSKPGKRLIQVRSMLAEDSQGLYADGARAQSAQPYTVNMERALVSDDSYGFGQVSTSCLRSGRLWARDRDGINRAWVTDKLEDLFQLFRVWLAPSNPPAHSLAVVMEAVRSLLVLSDLFTEKRMFAWMATTMVELYKGCARDDHILLRYVFPGLCKCVAVLDAVGTAQEDMTKMFEECHTSDLQSLRLAAVQGCMYLLEGRVVSLVQPWIPALTALILEALQSVFDPASLKLFHAAANLLIETCPTECEEMGFTVNIVQLSLSLVLRPSLTNDALFACVMTGLDRLLLSFALTKQQRDLVTAAKFQNSRFTRDLMAVGLMITGLYSGKESDRPSGFRFEEQGGGTPVEAMNTVSVVIMERVASLFDRIRRGGTTEATMLARVLPSLLDDFFPSRQVMNIVMSELTSTQQTKPEHVATIAHNVFANMQAKGQQGALREWAVLSMSSLLQRSPKSMAVAGLACLFVNVSQHPLIRSLAFYIISLTVCDKELDPCLFWLPTAHFVLSEELSAEALQMILSILSSIRESPYQELVPICEGQLAGAGSTA